MKNRPQEIDANNEPSEENEAFDNDDEDTIEEIKARISQNKKEAARFQKLVSEDLEKLRKLERKMKKSKKSKKKRSRKRSRTSSSSSGSSSSRSSSSSSSDSSSDDDDKKKKKKKTKAKKAKKEKKEKKQNVVNNFFYGRGRGRGGYHHRGGRTGGYY